VCVSWRRARPANGFVSQRGRPETWRAANRRLGTSRAKSGGDKAHQSGALGQSGSECHVSSPTPLSVQLLEGGCVLAGSPLFRRGSKIGGRQRQRLLGSIERAPPTRNRDVTVTMD
jgi:hypothetical protein